METKDGKLAVYAPGRKEWRKWLAENYHSGSSVWLILYTKKSLVPSINLNDATEEALCFGWIDSLCKKRDHESYYLTFGPRNPRRSSWSAINRERAHQMISKGLMMPQGQLMIDLAKVRGSWDS
ncbi:YdeI/OmpD-associated family protein [Pedobacter chitinilyticus]|uniref:Bacteriocin-protection protein n=1 Tax=Pedobacter chitinilyticus TaxID=2233776 RepID=A0A3S3PFT0_9SPHI|nr:hypothetical protein [Pedobacter chitinilyticus]RWU05036.1 hypothetical protein DPV69_17900 [Pedobacter chitinilyticus]